MCSLRQILSFCALILAASWHPAYADPFTYTTVDVGSQTSLTGINDNGQIVGTYGSGASAVNFLDDHGSITTLEFPIAGAVSGPTATGINNAGELVGSYALTPLTGLGFTYSHGVFTTLDFPGSSSPYYPQDPFTGALGINNTGQVVGLYAISGKTFGFLYSNGVYTTIDGGGDLTMAYGINDLGEIVGRTGQQGFLDVNGVFTLLSVPGSFFTEATGINNAGQIVGRFDGSGGQQGFVYDHGQYYPMSLEASTALAINNLGQFVGSYQNPPYNQHGFEAGIIATPEPDSTLLSGAGLICILLFYGRRNRASACKAAFRTGF